MLLKLAADFVVILHFSFIIFVVLGGVVVVRQPRLIWIHIPAVIWGAWIEFSGWVCPLTPLENKLRIAAGEAGYSGGFIERYLIPVLYPSELTRPLQISLGVAVFGINLIVYGWLIVRHLKARRQNL